MPSSVTNPVVGHSANVHSEPPRRTTAFNGHALNIDYPSCLAQHDIVYTVPPTLGFDGVALGDGDLSASVWCPGYLRMQMHRGDLWSDPPRNPITDASGPAENWRLASAGNVSLFNDASILAAPTRYEQRLHLYNGLMTIQADSPGGSCQITAFVSATAGVAVIHYEDQTLRGAKRQIEVSVQRNAHLFAVNDTIGVMQALRDRRYALIARTSGCRTEARQNGNQSVYLDIAPSRSCNFTLFVAVTTSPRDTDPLRMARARVDRAQEIGYATLLREHKRHWAEFWQKSFFQLSTPDSDPLPKYLENLWYLTLYHLACCSRGYDAPLPGALCYNEADSYPSPALYEGSTLRAMMAPLLPANHLELSVPYVETHHNLLARMAARTGSETGLSGVRFPARFNRFGDDFSRPSNPLANEKKSLPASPLLVKSGVGSLSSTSHSANREMFPSLTQEKWSETCSGISGMDNDGLETALLFWEAWRYAPDPHFLRERVYPILRACTVFSLEASEIHPDTLMNPLMRGRLCTALRALVWASEEIEIDEEEREVWSAAYRRLAPGATPYRPASLSPFPSLHADTASETLQRWLTDSPQRPQGLFLDDFHSPMLPQGEMLFAALNSLLLREEPLPLNGLWKSAPSTSETVQRPEGAEPGVLHIFPALPPNWNACLSLVAPGGFRLYAEAQGGMARYVAVRSLLGGICRLAHPWPGEEARVLSGRKPLVSRTDGVFEFETERSGVYVLERVSQPLFRNAPARISARANNSPKTLPRRSLGMDSATVLPVSFNPLPLSLG